MKTYDIYLFDLDGTLTNTMDMWLGIFRDGLADFGIVGLTDHQIAAHTHDWKEITKLGLPETDLPAFIVAAHKRATEQLPHAPLHSGAQEMLNALKKANKQLGLYTSMDRPLLKGVVERYKLDEIFGVIVSGSDVEARKPHPAGIVTALAGLEVRDPRSAVYIGDKDTDILCSYNAGVESILFYPPEHGPLYDKAELLTFNPTFTISHWRELTATL